MAATKYGKLTVTTAAQDIGDAEPQEFCFQTPADNSGSVFIAFNGDTAVDDQGWNLAPGKDVTNKDVPEAFKRGPFSIIGTADDVLYYTFSRTRGS